MIWPSEKGAKAQWTAMGDSCVDMKTLFNEWSKECTDTPVQIETISGFAKEFPYLEKDFGPPTLRFGLMIIHASLLFQEKESITFILRSRWCGP